MAGIRGSMDPTPEELDERRDMLAVGISPAATAVRFGRAVGTIYNQQTRDKDKIAARREELLGVVHAKTAGLWINDLVQSTEVLEALADDTIARRAEPNLPARDVSRYNRDARQFIRDAHEVNGLIKQRVQAEVASEGTITYELVGVDLNEVTKTWGQAGSAVVPAADAVPEPVPVPMCSEVPPEHMGKAAAEAAREQAAREPVFK